MQYRPLGRTGLDVSAISLGTWQVGGGWGRPFDDERAWSILEQAAGLGINFIDTADGYSDGQGERQVGRLVRRRPEKIILATKCGRRLRPHTADGYNRENITRFVDDSLANTGLEALDLIQLHCPPTDVYYRPEVFAVLDDLKQQGKILHYGVSVERVEEALKAIEYPGVETVQIIFNMFRLRPSELFFEQAQKRRVGVIVRVPLASGLLSGKFSQASQFDPKDHRFFNRDGQAFDKGETFSGVDYATGLEAVARLKAIFSSDYTLAQVALRWILMFDAVSCVIPGASRPAQVIDNAAAADMPPLSEEQMQQVRDLYDQLIRPSVHPLW
ncbi:MAG: aldo/keto reductase [Clostridiaceae bacterium]|nr:aldo/keto reductase [Clostridiaceae bacterium]